MERRTLAGLAEALLGFFGLVSCDISTSVEVGRAGTEGPGPVVGQTISNSPLVTPTGSIGALTVVRAASEWIPLSPPELGLLHTLAAQTALTIERMSLDGEVREARPRGGGDALPSRVVLLGDPRDLRTPVGIGCEGRRIRLARRGSLLQ